MDMQCVIDCSVFIFYTVIYGWTSGLVQEDFPTRAVDYIYYRDIATWNEARNVCLSIGGDLAKIDSKYVLDTIVQLSRDAFPDDNDLPDDFWIGLSDPTPDRREWAIDCSLLSFVGNYAETYESGDLCFQIQPSSNFMGTSRPCSESTSFLCERHPARRCAFKHRFRNVSVWSVSDVTDYYSCEDHCALDSTCGRTLFVSPSTCYKLSYKTQSNSLATVSSKVCAEFRVNDTLIKIWPNDSIFPEENCSMHTVEPLESKTPSISLMPSSSSTSISPSSTTAIIPVCSTLVLSESVSSPCLNEVSTATLTETLVTTVNVIQECSAVTPIPPVTVVATSSCLVPTSSATPMVNLSLQEAVDIGEKYAKNLTVNAKTTSSYLRKLTSAPDYRKTSTAIGTVGIVCIVIPLALVMSSDIKKLFVSLRCNKCQNAQI